MSSIIVVAPVVWPLLMAAMLLALWRHPRWQRIASVVGSAMHVTLAAGLFVRVLDGTLVTWLGEWAPPFGIVFVADRLGALLTLVTAFIGLMTTLYALSGIDSRREGFGFHALVHTLLAGVCGSFLTGDFFNLYVWFEVMLMASFVLLALGGEKRQMKAALRYVAMNLIASMTFLIALGLLYGLTGTLNMADVSSRLGQAGQPGLAGAVCALLMLAFSIKAAAFPVFGWLPASYPAPPSVVSALFAGLLTKVGVYALLRSTTLVFEDAAPYLLPIMLWVGIATVAAGALGAISRESVRPMLSYLIVSKIGVMLVGVAINTPLAHAAVVFYLVHDMVVKTALFMLAGIMRRMNHTEKLSDMGGLYARSPLLAALFLAGAMAIAGLPPLSGFWAKLFVLRGALDAQEHLAVGFVLASSLLALASMVRLWNEAFWKDSPNPPSLPDPAIGRQRWRYLPTGILIGASLALGIFAGPAYEIAKGTALQLVDPEGYWSATMQGGPR